MHIQEESILKYGIKIIHRNEELEWDNLNKGINFWCLLEKSGEFWVGTNNLANSKWLQ